MCNSWCFDFVTASQRWWPENPTILEVGSLDVNGSPRDVCQNNYASYVGVDLVLGPGVDVVCDVEELPDNPVGQQKYDVVISTEMLEHAHNWNIALFNLLDVVSVGGILVLTTRSPGFEYHPYPEDNWRFIVEDFQFLFPPDDLSFKLLVVEPDPDTRNGISCGVGIIVQKISLDIEHIQERFNNFKAYNVHTESR